MYDAKGTYDGDCAGQPSGGGGSEFGEFAYCDDSYSAMLGPGVACELGSECGSGVVSDYAE